MIDTVDRDWLWHLLTHAEENVRKQALDQLPPLTDPSSLALVSRLLGDPSRAVCEAAVHALVRSGEPATGLAVAHLDAEEPAERGYAVAALVRLGALATLAVCALLDDPDADMRKFAVDILAQTSDRAATPALIKALGDENVNIAAGAADALGALGAVEAVPALAAALARQSDWLRVAVLGALGELGGARALAAVCRVSPDSPGPVLAAAAVAVGKTGAVNAARAVELLASLLSRCTHQPLIDAVVCALERVLAGRMFWPSLPDATLCTLLSVLRVEGRGARPQVRAAAVYCLGLAGDLEAARASLIAPDDPGVCLAALRVLALNTAYGPEDAACRRLLQEVEDPAVRAAAVRVLLNHLAPDAPSLVAQLCGSDASYDCEDLLVVLRDCSADHLVPVVQYALTSTLPAVGRAMFRALCPTEDARKMCRSRGGKDVLRAAAVHEDWLIRAHAIGLLGTARARWARTILQRACDDPEARVRVRAIKALEQCELLAPTGDPVTRRLADASGWVRGAAVEALSSGGHLDSAQLLAALCDEFPPAALAGAHAAVTLAEGGGAIYTGAVQAALARLAETEHGREDQIVARWRRDLAGA